MPAPQSLIGGDGMWQEVVSPPTQNGPRHLGEGTGEYLASRPARHRKPTVWTEHRATLSSAACAVGSMTLWLVVR